MLTQRLAERWVKTRYVEMDATMLTNMPRGVRKHPRGLEYEWILFMRRVENRRTFIYVINESTKAGAVRHLRSIVNRSNVTLVPFDGICPQHPRYKAIRAPRVDCQPCRALYAMRAK